MAEKEDSETILARKGLWTSGVRVADNISNLGTSFGSYFSWISSSLRESSSKILRREGPSSVLTISEGPVGVDAPSDVTDDEVPAPTTPPNNPPLLVVDNNPAEAETPPPPPPPPAPTGSGEGSGEAIGEALNKPPAEEGSGVESRRLRMRNFV